MDSAKQSGTKQSAPSLGKGRRVVDKMGVNTARRHILMCYDRKEADCASKQQMRESWNYLRRRLKELKLSKQGGVLQTKAFCLDVCRDGPIAVVFPEGTWYGNCSPEVLEQVIQEHLIAGRVVEEHVLGQAPLCAGGLCTKDAKDDTKPRQPR